MRHFVAEVLGDPVRSPFIRDFLPLQKKVSRLGLLNGLSQTLLKLTVPGVPDIYHGNEFWTFQLVDPDNRRRVDYARRVVAVQALAGNGDLPLDNLLDDQLACLKDDRAKLDVTWRALQLRQALPRLFAGSAYQGLRVSGAKSRHVCAFARSHNGDRVVVAVGRWFADLGPDADKPPVGAAVWADTVVECPAGTGVPPYRDVLSNDLAALESNGGGHRFHAAQLFRRFPVALLHSR